ncbi:MAG: oxamate carbamoyltransferase subunit AllH family protein, partial [Alphaproteobacteria bacterium]
AETGNPISYAHLKAAAMGGRSDGIHQVLTAIFKGCPNSILENLPNIDNIGHTSGWDCMAGIVFALDCWLTVQTHKMNN